ncbi:MAG: phosphoribosylglycinamide formyltransferase [Prevotella sp.]|nr:phosphoribosylglycinamide formyltransferase [Prevotella sp.]MBQ5605837.1 phosphoribosylglycinamide formyltransferase [Prevotella sp.]MBQ8629414.1 phosphoribosylglycinamide formyltransferase [Prevotella sp.]MEE1092648.1 phosphoribosylglycinamide formyltransferase [Prevotella sp.]
MNIAILASGSGTNCENIIKHFQHSKTIKVALVISNKADAYALTRAQNLNVPTCIISKDDFRNEKKVMDILDSNNIEFIILAGFLLMVPTFILNKYKQRIINIHPSLLPKYGGKGMYGRNVHVAVKESGDTKTGITIHFIDEIYDNGEHIAQFSCPITEEDSVEDIEHKVHELEKRYYPSTIESVLMNYKD